MSQEGETVMKNLQNSAEVRAFSCVWILTGDPRQPLVCHWIDDAIPSPKSTCATLEEKMLQTERRRLCV